MIKAILTAAAVAILTGCAAATPLLIAEAGAIAVLAVAAYLMSMKDKLSLEKKELRK